MSKPDLHKVKVSIPDGLGIFTKLAIDDQEIKGVTFVSFEVGVDHWATMTLSLYADIEIEGEAEIVKEWRKAAPFHDPVAHEEHTARTQLWPPPTPVPGCFACEKATEAIHA